VRYFINKCVFFLFLILKVYFIFKTKDKTTVRINPIPELRRGAILNISTKITSVEK